MPDLIRNVDHELREILSQTLGLDTSEIFANRSLAMSADDAIFFWRRVEEVFDCYITRSQKESLRTVGELVHYLKIRLGARALREHNHSRSPMVERQANG